MKKNGKTAKNVHTMTGPELVLHFWGNVWNHPHDHELIDDLMVEDFVITNAGKDIVGRENFKDWVKSILKVSNNFRLENLEIFESKDGSRVVSRWVCYGNNNGILGLPADNRPFSFTGIAIWEIRGNKLAHNWVERSVAFNEAGE
ncbi:ester cyclase [Puia sp.]|jgi:hypothetical protein|uniref:ester cyclase n=1 Tax=Puia sp. TaxID=2045100 RepID=UPI002F404B3A